ncbi:MAG: hypothetical protein OEZ43_15740 [Gammaproteobacteria bacterium]|nr:hypothetical protein [Gammaproteobacteria bacterium]
MFLKHFVYVNWGNIPPLEFEFGPVNLFSGGNGSGKTTAADAIQTVMTAAHENLFQFNPGQDETTQRGRGGKRVRTLASYVLGCDDGSYARLDPTDGYLAAVFHPSKGESGEPFTAIIAIRAWIDRAGSNTVARQEDAQFFIIAGEQLTRAHFVREDVGGEYVTPLNTFQNLLIKEFGKRRVEKYETKKAYLRRLYGALRGREDGVPEVEAVAAARAFSRFMAYKPVQSINRFVADEILEQKDLGDAVRDVSSQLKTIHSMERESSRLVESIDILERAKNQSQSYIEQWIELNVVDYTLAQAEYFTRQSDYVRGKQIQREQRIALKEKQDAITEVQQHAKEIREQLISLEAQRQGVDALRKKDELENQKRKLDEKLVQQVRYVLDQDRIISANLQTTREIKKALGDEQLIAEMPRLAEKQNRQLADGVAESGDELVQDIHTLVQRDFSGEVPAIERRMDDLRRIQHKHNQWHACWHEQGSGESNRDRLSTLVHGRRSRYQTLSDQRKQKQHEITRLQNHQVSYPPYVERAIKAIRQEYPAADPRVLCDHVEVRDARWQAAIEGYLGGTRFSILVEPEYEAQAIRVVRNMPGRDNRARVIQGEKAFEDSERIDLHPDSMIHVLEFSHAVARAYLIASYGSVLRVNSADELRKTRRGITEDGMGSGNYSMWRCDLPDAELVFGAAARERALTAKRAELEKIEQEWNSANDRLQQAQLLLRSVDTLKPSIYADVLSDIIASHREMKKLDGLLEQLDLSDHKELELKLKQLKQTQDELSNKEAQYNQSLGKIQEKLKEIDKQISAVGKLQELDMERVESREEALNAISAVWPDFDANARLETADREARETNKDHLASYRHDLERRLHQAERKMAEELQQHNQHCRTSDTIGYIAFVGEYDASLFTSVCALQREIDRIYNILRNNILAEKHKQLSALKEAFNNAFVTHLCHSIYQALNDGRRQIEHLNKELQHHRFGADRETFRFASDWIPEFRDYARFFEDLVKNPTLGDEVSLFEAELSTKSKKVLDELMRMLLDEDETRAMHELQRIADYRNYRRYEIYKEVEGKEPIPLSEYGTGSGGQLETPAYIIRSAAITSAFRFAEGNTHLRMVLVDEAFSKMDETRSREVINYLTESLGLQLVFIMPTSKCGPYMDLISNEFVFAKVPSARLRGELKTRVLVDRKQCNQERIKSLWKNHRRTVYQQAELDFMEEVLADA